MWNTGGKSLYITIEIWQENMSKTELLQHNRGMLEYDDGTVLPYEIIKSERRTIAVQVKKDGSVVVRLPGRVSWEAGHEFAREHREWIYQHSRKILESIEKREQFHWKEGETLLLYGQERRLHLECDYETERIRVCDTGERILVSGPFGNGKCDLEETEVESVVQKALEAWYRKVARRYLEEKTAWWAKQMGVTYLRIAIRDQETRWGSCSACGNLNYNWKLVLLPEELADYVVVHELAHRTEMNHSKDFWRIVERELPDYGQRRRRLKGYEKEINQKY